MTFRVIRDIVTGHPVRYALGIMIGFLSAQILVAIGALSIRSEVTAGNILQASATVITGLLIAFVVQKTLQNSAREKDFLIQQLDSLASCASELSASDDGQPLTEVAAVLKKIRILSSRVHDVVTSLDRRGLKACEFDFAEDVTKLRRLATETPTREIIEHASSKSRAKTEVKNGIITLAKEREAELEAKLQDFSNRILKAQVAVIKA